MKTSLTKLVEELSQDIESSYQSGITMEEAEKLAGKFLHGQMQVSAALKDCDLDTRMKKSGLKAVKAAVYMEEATKADKKPSDTFLQNIVDQAQVVNEQQDAFDEADCEREQLQNYLMIFREAHIHFRSIAKGRFE